MSRIQSTFLDIGAGSLYNAISTQADRVLIT